MGIANEKSLIILGCGINNLGKWKLLLKEDVFRYVPHIHQGEQKCTLETFYGVEQVWYKGIDLECKDMCAFELSTSVSSTDGAELEKI